MAKPYKVHLNGDNVRTLCGLAIKQLSNLPLGNPWNIDCKNCLSLYYLENKFNPAKVKDVRSVDV